MRFNGKVVVITGAAGGQGQAAARLFAEEGARLVVTDIDEGEQRRQRKKYVMRGERRSR